MQMDLDRLVGAMLSILACGASTLRLVCWLCFGNKLLKHCSRLSEKERSITTTGHHISYARTNSTRFNMQAFSKIPNHLGPKQNRRQDVRDLETVRLVV